MKTFADTTGRSWRIVLNLGTAMAVKDALGVDLLQPELGDPPLLLRLGTDEILLGRVLCALLADQFEAHGVDEQDVQDAFDGPTLLAAQTAFYEELVDFFRSRGRPDRATAVAKQVATIEAAVAAIDKRIEAMDADKMISGAMSGLSPDPSASTPDP